MKKLLSLILLLILSISLHSQSFSSFITYLNALPENQRQSKVDSFMTSHPHTPYMDADTNCHFLYLGTTTSVKIAGDFTQWNPNLSMISVAGTDFWYHSARFEADARLDYKIVVNGSNWILDPKNTYTCQGGFGPNSELRMPLFQSRPEIEYYANIHHGTIVDTSFFSTNLNNSRTIRIYLPPGYGSIKKEYPVIVFHDGPDYITLGKTKNILDYLIDNKSIQPVIGIFVPAVNRTEEYNGSKKEKYTKFIVEELMPNIDQRYMTSKNPQKRANIGASSGGNISLYIGMKHPEAFGKIAAQSSSIESVISSTFQSSEKMNLELYLDYGTYDIPVIVSWGNNFIPILQEKGYTYQFKTWHEGHSWGNWKGHLYLPLLQFFPFHVGLNENAALEQLQLGQNYPNPFRATTRIDISAPAGNEAELSLFNVTGKRVATLFSGTMLAENQTIEWNNNDLGAGVYIYSLSSGSFTISRKMNIIK
jgi:enterochelin esterase-like enzyme